MQVSSSAQAGDNPPAGMHFLIGNISFSQLDDLAGIDPTTLETNEAARKHAGGGNNFRDQSHNALRIRACSGVVRQISEAITADPCCYYMTSEELPYITKAVDYQ